MDPVVPVQNKNFAETQRSLQKFLELKWKPKVIYTHNSPEFCKACEVLSWNQSSYVNTSPLRNKWDCWESGTQNQGRTSAVLLRSGLDEKWWADSMECYCYLRNVQDLLAGRKTPYERRFGKSYKGPIIPFGALVEYLPNSEKDKARIHQFGKKVLRRISIGYALIAGRIWKGDVLIADIEELEKLDASEKYHRRLNAKEVLITPKRRRMCISCGRWFSNIIRNR